jgi:hypothetical protein
MKGLIVSIIVVLLSLCTPSSSAAQCAMCRSTLENNFSNGDPGIAAGINTGILYLLCMPYLAFFVIAYFWRKSSKHADKELSGRTVAR